MTLQTSSAQPDMLFRYSEQAQEINRALSAEANWLGGRLARFESTCVESAFRVSIAGLDSSLRSHANQADAIDVGVRAVGQQFLDADRGLEILVQEATIVIEPPSPAIKKTGDIVDWIWEHLIKPLLGSDNETEDDKEELDNSKLGVSDSATITIPDPGG